MVTITEPSSTGLQYLLMGHTKYIQKTESLSTITNFGVKKNMSKLTYATIIGAAICMPGNKKDQIITSKYIKFLTNGFF